MQHITAHTCATCSINIIVLDLVTLDCLQENFLLGGGEGGCIVTILSVLSVQIIRISNFLKAEIVQNVAV